MRFVFVMIIIFLLVVGRFIRIFFVEMIRFLFLCFRKVISSRIVLGVWLIIFVVLGLFDNIFNKLIVGFVLL